MLKVVTVDLVRVVPWSWLVVMPATLRFDRQFFYPETVFPDCYRCLCKTGKYTYKITCV